MPPNQEKDISAETFVDYLTCGRCATEFPLQNITTFIQHKKNDCLDHGLHQQQPHYDSKDPDETTLSCYLCFRNFMTARGLLKHVELSHNLRVFVLREKTHSETQHENDKILHSVERCGSEQSEVSVEPEDSHESDSNPRRTMVEITDGQGQKLSRTCAELAAASGKTTICCNSQECCVTIIPGTHEGPKKCCSAVVPKKRKLHTAEHMRNEDKEFLDHYTDDNEEENEPENEDIGDADDDSSRGAIYIDFCPRRNDSEDAPEESFSVQGKSEDEHSWSKVEISGALHDEKEPYSLSPSKIGSTPVVTDRGSVIMQPGMMYSIPVTYSYAETCTEARDGTYSYSVNPQRAVFTVGTANVTKVTSSNIQGNEFIDSISSVTESSQSLHVCVQQDVSDSATMPDCSSVTGESRSSVVISKPLSEEESLESGSRELNMMDTSVGDENSSGTEKRRRYPTSRPFKCEQCDHAFNQRIHLKKHMSKHTGVKPFKCQQCDYSTVERSHLKVHIRIHTGEKPFKCTFCEYATAQNSTLKIHLKRHHGGKMFECHACRKKFTQEVMLHHHETEHQKAVFCDGILDDKQNVIISTQMEASGFLTNQNPASLVETSTCQERQQDSALSSS